MCAKTYREADIEGQNGRFSQAPGEGGIELGSRYVCMNWEGEPFGLCPVLGQSCALKIHVVCFCRK